MAGVDAILREIEAMGMWSLELQLPDAVETVRGMAQDGLVSIGQDGRVRLTNKGYARLAGMGDGHAKMQVEGKRL